MGEALNELITFVKKRAFEVDPLGVASVKAHYKN